MTEHSNLPRHRSLIGIWSSSLQAPRPRGLQRVAREVAGRFRFVEGVDFVAVTSFEYVEGVLYAEICHLGDYIASVSWQSHDALLDLKAQGFTQTKIPARHLSVVLSFECFDDLWNWPLQEIGLKTVCVVHDLIPFRIVESDGFDNKTRYYKALGRTVEKAAALICVSRATEDDLIKYFPAARGRTAVIHNGFGSHNLGEFGSDIASKRWDPEYSINILMVGTVEPRKNHISVLLALPDVAERFPKANIVLSIVGDNLGSGDIFGTKLKGALEMAQSVARVEFTNHVADDVLRQYIMRADICVFPSLWEGFGIPILEAYDAGLAVVASDVPSHLEVSGGYSFLCDPYDHRDVAAKIIEALRETAADSVTRLIGAKLWASRFDWDHVAATYVRLFQSLDQHEALPTFRMTPGSRLKVSLHAKSEFERLVVLTTSDLTSNSPAALALRDIACAFGDNDCVVVAIENLSEPANVIEAIGKLKLADNVHFVPRLVNKEDGTLNAVRTCWLLLEGLDVKAYRLGALLKNSRILTKSLFAAQSARAFIDTNISFVEIFDGLASWRTLTPFAHNGEVEWFCGLARAVAANCAVARTSAAAYARQLIHTHPVLAYGVRLAVIVETLPAARTAAAAVERFGLDRVLIVSATPIEMEQCLVLPFTRARVVLLKNVGGVVYIQSGAEPDEAVSRVSLEREHVYRVASRKVESAAPMRDVSDLSEGIRRALETASLDRAYGGYDELVRAAMNFGLSGASDQARSYVGRPKPSVLRRLSAFVDNLLCGRTMEDFITACVPKPNPRPKRCDVIEITSVSGRTYRFAASATGEELAGIKEMAEAVSACQSSSSWADLELAWSTKNLEQIFRLHKIPNFAMAIYMGESEVDDVSAGPESHNPAFIWTLAELDCRIIVAGGDYKPLPESEIFFTGPIANAGPVIAAANMGLVVPVDDDVDAWLNVRAVLRFLLDGLHVLVDAPTKSLFEKEFPDGPSDALIVYATLTELKYGEKWSVQKQEKLRTWVLEKSGRRYCRVAKLDEARLAAGAIIHDFIEDQDRSNSIERLRSALEKLRDEEVASILAETFRGVAIHKNAFGLKTDQGFWRLMSNASDEKIAEIRQLFDLMVATSVSQHNPNDQHKSSVPKNTHDQVPSKKLSRLIPLKTSKRRQAVRI